MKVSFSYSSLMTRDYKSYKRAQKQTFDVKYLLDILCSVAINSSV